MGYNKAERETALIAELIVFEAAGREWLTADQICSRAGLGRTQGRRAAARLAVAGVLERRDVSWRSSKSKMRLRVVSASAVR